MNNKPFRKLNSYLKYFVYASIILVLFAAAFFLYYQGIKQDRINTIKNEELGKVQSEAVYLSTVINESIDDSFFLSKLPGVCQLVSDKHESMSELEDSLMSFMSTHSSILQLRYLNENGLERFRIDNKNGAVVRTDSSGLQDKSGRDYFIKSNQLVLIKLIYQS